MKKPPTNSTTSLQKVAFFPAICSARWGDCANPFRIRTYGNKDLKSFRMRTYKKEQEGVGPEPVRLAP